MGCERGVGGRAAHSSDGVVAAAGGEAEIYTVGWLRLSPGPPMESGAEEPAEAASEEEEGDGQDDDVELQEVREVDPEHISVAVAEAEAPLTLCGDSSLISIWFFLGPVEMF